MLGALPYYPRMSAKGSFASTVAAWAAAPGRERPQGSVQAQQEQAPRLLPLALMAAPKLLNPSVEARRSRSSSSVWL